MKVFYFLLMGLFINNAFGLDVDEKLTMRIVKVSQTRKTILINRGLEDGLVKGDHAKFFLTVGVVARGVMIKGSPTRSVWSIYRLVNTDYLRNDQVMNLKITAPVKITKDESRMLVKDDSPTIMKGDPRDLGIPLAEGAEDMTEEERAMLQNKTVTVSTAGMSQDINEWHREIFVTLFMGQFSSTTTPNKNTQAYTATESLTTLNLGYEFYFKDRKQWFSRFSLYGMMALTRASVMSHEGANSSENSTEWGGGVNWYPIIRPDKSNTFIYYGAFDFMMGSTTTTMNPGENSAAKAESLTGAIVSYSIGAGVKFYTNKGYGARMKLDYYMRGDKFGTDSFNTSWIKNKSGPRITMGFSYRF
jgi:hypothetical protein